MNGKGVVCESCERAMILTEVGVFAYRQAEEDDAPDVVWSADRYVCPGCGFSVLTDFAKQPMAYVMPDAKERERDAVRSGPRQAGRATLFR